MRVETSRLVSRLCCALTVHLGHIDTQTGTSNEEQRAFKSEILQRADKSVANRSESLLLAPLFPTMFVAASLPQRHGWTMTMADCGHSAGCYTEKRKTDGPSILDLQTVNRP